MTVGVVEQRGQWIQSRPSIEITRGGEVYTSADIAFWIDLGSFMSSSLLFIEGCMSTARVRILTPQKAQGHALQGHLPEPFVISLLLTGNHW